MQLDPHDPIPIYGTPLTLGLISVKLREHGMLGRVIQNPISEGQHAQLGPFDIEPIAVNHSIPDAVGLVIRTPVGIVFHTGARPLSRKRVYQIWRRALSKEVPCPQWVNEGAVLGVRKPLANWLGRPVTPMTFGTSTPRR